MKNVSIDCSDYGTSPKTQCTISAEELVDLQLSCQYSSCNIASLKGSTLASYTGIQIDCQNAVLCRISADNTNQLELNCNSATNCKLVSTDTIDQTQTNVQVDCSRSATCNVDVSYIDIFKFSCASTTTSCTLALNKITNEEINLLSAPITPTITCTDLSANSFQYTGTIYMYGLTLTLPTQCSTITYDPSDNVTVLNNSVTIDKTETSVTALSFKALCVTISTCGNLMAQVSSRDITSLFDYGPSVPLSGGKPQVISDFATRVTNAREVLSNKQAYTYAKTSWFTPTKHIPSGFYNYEPETLITNTYYHPPFKFNTPPIGTLSTAGNMVPTITDSYLYNYTIPDLCKTRIYDSTFYLAYISDTTVNNETYFNSFKERQDFQRDSWNHFAIYCQDNNFQICLNNYCKSTWDFSSFSLIQREIRFFYKFKGRVSEFKLWEGNQLQSINGYYGKVGPYTIADSANLLAYYKFDYKSQMSSSVGYFFYDYNSENQYSSTGTQYFLTKLTTDDFPGTQFDTSFKPKFDFCADGLFFLGPDYYCSTMTFALKAISNQSILKLYKIDFTEPTEYSFHFWFKSTFSTQASVTSYQVIDGPFDFTLQSTSSQVSLISTMIDSAQTGIITSDSDKWIQCSQSVRVTTSGSTSTRSINHYITQLNNIKLNSATDSVTIGASNSWPLGSFIYIGSSNPSTIATAPKLSVKNIAFLKTKITMSEHLVTMYSEYVYKKAALFYFPINEGRFSQINNGMTPYQKVSNFQDGGLTNGFIWEREIVFPKFCPDYGDQVYEWIYSLCRPKKVQYPNYSWHQFRIAGAFEDLTAYQMPHTYDFTISYYAWLDKGPVGTTQQLFSANSAYTNNAYDLKAVPTSTSTDLSMTMFTKSMFISTLGTLLNDQWVHICFVKSYESSQIIGTLYAHDKSARVIISPLSGTTTPWDNTINIQAPYSLSNPNIMNYGRFAHARIYKYAIPSPTKLTFSHYFDFTFNQYLHKYYPLDNNNNAQIAVDVKYWDSNSTSPHVDLIYANSYLTSSNAIDLAQNEYLDDFYYVYKPVRVSGASISTFSVTSDYTDWCLDLMYQSTVDSNQTLVTISNFLTVQLVQDTTATTAATSYNKYYIQLIYNDTTGTVKTLQSLYSYKMLTTTGVYHLAISFSGSIKTAKLFLDGAYIESLVSYPDAINIQSSVNLTLTLNQDIFFRFFRLWNVYIKHYSAMQLRNRAINYYHMKDKVLIWYDISENTRYYPNRIIYYNKQFQPAEDSPYAYDTSPASATSPTNLLNSGYCTFNQSYSSSGCQQQVYIPLDISYVNQMQLPLHYGNVSNQNTYQDFSLGFWILLKDSTPAGTFMLLNFDQNYYLSEYNSQGDQIMYFRVGTGGAQQQLFARNNFKQGINQYSSWHYVHMVYTKSTDMLLYYVDNTNYYTINGASITLSSNKVFQIELCPKTYTGGIPDCDTVIAYVKLWLTNAVSFSDQCDYRMDDDQFQYLASYWPLTYLYSAIPYSNGYLTESGPFGLYTSIGTSSQTSNLLFMTIFEIYPEGGENIAQCSYGQVFDTESNSGFVGDTFRSLKFYKSNQNVGILLTSSLQTFEWTVEFWFQFLNSKIDPQKSQVELILAGHNMSTCSNNTRFQITLMPVTNSNSIRFVQTAVANSSTNSQTLSDNTQKIEDRTWHHYALVNDWLDSEIIAYTNYQQKKGSIYQFNMLSNCIFYLGDNSGDPLTYLLDNSVKIKEIRTWNVAKEPDELRYYSIYPALKSSLNLMTYYKLSESSKYLFEKLFSDWSFTTPTYTISTYDFVKHEFDYNDFFLIDCPPGMSGSVNYRISGRIGCNPYSKWIYTAESKPAAQIKYDLSNQLSDKIINNDVQLTIGIYMRQMTDSNSYSILELENLFKFYRSGSAYKLDLYFNDTTKTLSSDGTYLLRNSYTDYVYLFVVIDWINQNCQIIDYDTQSATMNKFQFTINGQSVTNYTFQTSNIQPSYSIKVGDTQTTSQVKQQINHISMFNRKLTDAEFRLIAYRGARTYSPFEYSLENQYLLSTNDKLYNSEYDRTFYSDLMDDWAVWDEQSNTFSTADYIMSLCPYDYVLSQSSSTSTETYAYCIQKGTFVMKDQTSIVLSLEALKDNTRYAWSLIERFKIQSFTSSAASVQTVSLCTLPSTLEIYAASNNTLCVSLYTKAGSLKFIKCYATSTVTDGKWHALGASLFNFTWKIYVDYSLLASVNDTIINYNDTNLEGNQFSISLQNAQNSTQLALADVAIFGIPLNENEFKQWAYQGSLNLRQYEGILLMYYDFDQSTYKVLNDLSIYGKFVEISSSVISDQVSDPYYWIFDDVDSDEYFSTPEITAQINSNGKDQFFTKDKSLYFNNSTITLSTTLTLDSEHTIELCYYLTETPTFGGEILRAFTGTKNITQIYFKNTTSVTYSPISSSNVLSINAGTNKEWQCITAASSYAKKYLYFVNFYQMKNNKAYYTDSQLGGKFKITASQTLPRTILLGRTFTGSLREVRIWKSYLNPGIARRQYRSQTISNHNPYLAAYWPINDGFGNFIQEFKSGNQLIINSLKTPWVKLDSTKDRLEICEGERVYSEGDYCLTQDKFLKMHKNSLNLTIQGKADDDKKYDYPLMGHSTIVMWISIKKTSSSVTATSDILKVDVPDRYTARIWKNKTLTIVNNNGETIVYDQDFSDFFGSWGFISLSCSSKVGSCEVHYGGFVDNQWDISLDNGALTAPFYHDDLYNWQNISSCTVQIQPSQEPQKFSVYMKELQLYQVMLPYQSILLKMNLAVKSNMFKTLLVQLKMDEFSGTRLYNHAYDPSKTFYYVDVSDIQWVYYKETIDYSSSQQYDTVDYMFCNKENFTYVGDHCEYYQCHDDCYEKGKIGLCRGWQSTECAQLEQIGTGIVYDPDSNDYLSCYKFCSTCVQPYVNTKCTTCISGTYSYIDTQGLYAVKNQSCWEKCPDSTYLDTVTGMCKDCPNYCICKTDNPKQCLSCMNSTLKFDIVRNKCLLKCPSKTYYNTEAQTCQACSKECKSCSGSSPNDCLDCITGYSKYVNPQNKTVCVDKNCPQGYYFEEWNSVQCEPCSQQCYTCLGPGQENCTKDCKEGYSLYQQAGDKQRICYSCKQIAEINDRYQAIYLTKYGKCDEICGDGFNMKIRECDDGNTENGDGCSDQCKIEKNFECHGGNETRPDKCVSTITPVPIFKEGSIKTGASSSSIEMTFSYPVYLNEEYLTTYENYIIFDVTGPDQPYEYTYTITKQRTGNDYIILIVNYQVSFDIDQGSDIMFQISILKDGFLKSIDGVSVKKGDYLINPPKIKIQRQVPQTIESAIDSFETIMLTVLIMNLCLSVILGDGLQHMWNLINYLQILYYMPLIGVEFHSLSMELFKYLVFVTADFFSEIPQYLDLFINLDDLQDETPINERFSNLEISSKTMVQNYYQKFELFMLIIIAWPVFKILSMLIKHKYIGMPFRLVSNSLSFNFPLQFLAELYLELAVIIWVNVYAGLKFENQAQIISSVIALTVFLVVTGFPVFSYSVIMDNFNKLNDHDFHSRLGALIESTKVRPGSTINQMLNPLFLFRRYTYAAVLVCLQDYPVIQVLLCLAQSILTLAFLIYVRPFESWDLNLLFVVNEFTVLSCFALVAFFTLDYSDKEGTYISYGLIGILCFDIMINLIFVFYDLISKFIKMFKRLCAKWKTRQLKQQLAKLNQDNQKSPDNSPKIEETEEFINLNKDSRQTFSQSHHRLLFNQLPQDFNPEVNGQMSPSEINKSNVLVGQKYNFSKNEIKKELKKAKVNLTNKKKHQQPKRQKKSIQSSIADPEKLTIDDIIISDHVENNEHQEEQRQDLIGTLDADVYQEYLQKIENRDEEEFKVQHNNQSKRRQITFDKNKQDDQTKLFLQNLVQQVNDNDSEVGKYGASQVSHSRIKKDALSQFQSTRQDINSVTDQQNNTNDAFTFKEKQTKDDTFALLI